MKFALRVVIVAVVVVAVLVVALHFLGPDKGPSSVRETYAVGRGTIEQTVQGTGVLECATAATILSKVEGKLSKPLVKEGEAVAEDQLLMRITNDEIVTAVNLKKTEVAKLEETLEEVRKPVEERVDVKKAKAASERAREEYERKQRQLDDEEALGETSSLSPRELEDLRQDVKFAKNEAELAEDAYEEAKKAITEADVQEAEEKVAQAKAELGRLQEQADGREVRSPIKGTVLKVMIEPEALAVEPDKEYPEETPLFVVADLESMLVRGQIYQSDEAKMDRTLIDDPELTDGERIQARVNLSGLGRTLDGMVSYLALTPEQSSSGVGQFEVKIEFPTPPKGVTSGLQVSFDIIVGRVENALVVPVRFVELQGSKAYVRKVGESKPVEVRLGASDNNFFQVLDGLNEGDEIEWERTSR